MDIHDKVVVLTGAGNGIGAAMALRFAREGARGIVVSDRVEADALRVAAQIEASGGQAIGLAVDVSDEAGIQHLVALARSRYGSIDIVCSNAGVVDEGGVDAPNARWQRSWDINLMAHVYAARAALPHLIEQGSGYLVNTCSAAGLLTSPGAAPYAVTKHAAIALAEWLSITHGDQGVRVSVVCPQAVDTRLLQQSIQSGNTASRAFATMGTLLTPESVADCVIQGMREERFLILPHPEVESYMQRKAQDVNRWLHGMRRFTASARTSEAP